MILKWAVSFSRSSLCEDGTCVSSTSIAVVTVAMLVNRAVVASQILFAAGRTFCRQTILVIALDRTSLACMYCS
jgi:hypothetical protein